MPNASVSSGQTGPATPSFSILVVDGTPTLLTLAEEALADLSVDGASVRLIGASSAAEARQALYDSPEIAVILLEPVLEQERAGLDLIAHIRNDLGNQRTRVVVCTAHPDSINEEEVISGADVSDYRAKATLTPRALRTAVTGQLRAFASLQALAAGRKGLARMLVATTGLLELRTPETLFPNILPRVVGLLGIGRHALLCIQGDTQPRDRKIRVRASIGRFAPWKDVELSALGEARIEAALARLSPSSETIVEADFCALRLRANGGVTGMIYVEGRNDGTAREWQLLELFRNKCAIAFENALLFEELNIAQKATVLAMGSLTEYKDNAAPGHLQRIERLVGEIARELLARGQFSDELDAECVEKIGLAALLHDVGMMSVSDETLGMPGELASNDLVAIRRHTEIGHRILSAVAAPLRGRSLLSIAAEIARYHHERYDGSGYVEGLAGDAIPISARITAVADVFDALITHRPYRSAWTVEQAIDWIRARSGQDFDPRVVEAFLIVIRRLQSAEPDWFPKTNAGQGVLGGLLGRKLRDLFGRRAVAP
ncbi:response regulator [Azospirillum sp.]|uniref:response regulator n=1 Tax=Azospirillum sp. TaxID=34012 RepID=UPI00260410ED|nr:response regulator [Azospirillum sp.]